MSFLKSIGGTFASRLEMGAIAFPQNAAHLSACRKTAKRGSSDAALRPRAIHPT